jgi:hypothetical protein
MLIPLLTDKAFLSIRNAQCQYLELFQHNGTPLHYNCAVRKWLNEQFLQQQTEDADE